MEYGIILKLFSLLALGAVIGSFTPDDKANNFQLKDSHGKSHSLDSYKGNWVVLEWTNFGCPFVKKHYDSNNMQQLQKKYTQKGVIWLSICSSAPSKQGHYNDMAELNKKISDYKCAHTAYLIDEDGSTGKKYSARTTPQIVIINPEGYIVYNGAIDDMPSTDKDDIAGARNYPSEVLDAVLSGKESPHSRTKPYGCSVKYND